MTRPLSQILAEPGDEEKELLCQAITSLTRWGQYIVSVQPDTRVTFDDGMWCACYTEKDGQTRHSLADTFEKALSLAESHAERLAGEGE